MIARIWRGAVRREDGEAYGEYIKETGLAGYVGTPGNRGAWMLRRDVGELPGCLFRRSEGVEAAQVDAVKAFAGEDYATAVYYPEDERYLVERDEKCAHYEVHAHGADGG